MMKPELKYSILACALAASLLAHAQTRGPTARRRSPKSSSPAPRAPVTAPRRRLRRTALFDTPASITAIGRTQMQDLSIRSTTEAVRFDASVSDAYNAVGYAEQFSIRGFALDNNYSYRKDGFAIPGDTQIPLENKERIEC
jgi:iron complex outermembrane receptor protein